MRTKKADIDADVTQAPERENFVSAKEAMEMLGVSAQTLYAYVSRKGLRSVKVAGTRQRRYWKADIEQIRKKKAVSADDRSGLRQESEITLVTENDLFYRGKSAIQLAEHASFESVAALLWGVEEQQAFTEAVPQVPALWTKIDQLLAEESQVHRAAAIFPLLEEANPRAFDLSHLGMARSGADILRWLAAITVQAKKPSAEPIHVFLARELKLGAEDADVVRRMLVLAADSGFEQSAVAVRALASTGVTPWCAVAGGLSVSLGRKSRFGSFDAISRLLAEVLESADPRAAVIRWVRASEELPGFESPSFAQNDPRARALMKHMDQLYASETKFKRLKEAVRTVKEVKGAEPNFALVAIYLGMRIGIGARASLFHIGRAAGWIAHAIEQYQFGELKRQSAVYRGPLPQAVHHQL